MSLKTIPRCALCVAALLLAAALPAIPAEAAWPGREGAVLYRGLEPGFESEGWEPVGLSQTGLGVFQIKDRVTTDPGDQDPQVSPNGRLVVFARGVEANEYGGVTARAIFVMRRDGSQLRQLTRPHPASSDLEPTFDASGQRVLFVRVGDETVRGTSRGDIYSVNLAGQDLQQLTSGPAADSSPAASPRGRQVVFVRRGWQLPGGGRSNLQHLFSMRPDGSRLRDLMPRLNPRAAAADPDFSPDGRIIAFTISGGLSDIFTMRANGARLRRLTGRNRHAVLHAYGYSEPAFSPAGGRLFAVAKNIYNTDLARIDLAHPDHPDRLSSGDQPVWAPAARGR